MAALAVALAGALLTSDPTGGVNAAIEGLSSGSSGSLASLAELLPLGFAFAAGLVSAVNPCGFVLLPAYLGVFLGESDGDGRAEVHTAGRVRRGLVVGLTLTAGFVILFVSIGLAIGSIARFLVDLLPWVGLAVGIGLIVAGGYRLAGGSLYSALPGQLSARLAGGLGEEGGRPPGLAAYFLFGLAYGLASLSCTLPIFLAVLGGSLAAPDLGPMLGRLVLYALGMGSLIITVTIAVAVFKAAAARRFRGLSRVAEPLGIAFLFVAGTYVVYYWLTIGGLLGSATA
jgi:cytochrome c biogenesis protein CcdA